MQQSIRLKSVQVSSNDLSGGLASGITSRVMGGRFWDGFRMGVITAGLNHAVHSVSRNIRIDKQLKDAGFENPEDPVEEVVIRNDKGGFIGFDNNEAKNISLKMATSVDELSNLYDKAGSPDFEITRGGSAHQAFFCKVILKRSAFNSYRKLAIMIGHELVHNIHIWSGDWYRCKTKTSSYNSLKAYSEMKAYRWELNWGGNINYGSKKSPLQQYNYYKSRSTFLIKYFGE